MRCARVRVSIPTKRVDDGSVTSAEKLSIEVRFRVPTLEEVDAQIDERTLREIYLPAFERVVTASQPWTIMCSYNKVNGQSASENTWLLTTVLREEFGFAGLVVSDWRGWIWRCRPRWGGVPRRW